VSSQNAQDGLVSYGGFLLERMELALPMSSLREVVPLSALTPLPCRAACVMGGIDLRGVVVPVVDLSVLLGQCTQRADYPCVIVMVHEGRLLGLLSDGITGIFEVRPDSVHPISSSNAEVAIFDGSLLREDSHSLVSVLSAQALAQLPGVPMVNDPEPGRQLTHDVAEEVVIQDDSLPMMLMRCGRVPLAIDAMVAYTTVADPQVQASVLAMGHCRGVMEHAGLKIPVVDLQSLCGLGQLDRDAGTQAFIVSMPEGMVAFLIGEVVDVVRTQPGDVIKVPSFALPIPGLFAGALPMSALPPEVVERTGLRTSQYLLLDAQALKALPEVSSLARTNTQAGQTVGLAAHSLQGTLGKDATKRSMITYALDRETATPLEQVTEILAFSPDISVFPTEGAMLGFMVHQSRSIPVLCLTQLMGAPRPQGMPSASVLVVESCGELVGFAVPQLKMIEPADWEPELPDMGSRGGGPKGRKLVQVGSGASERMLPMLDLQAMAARFQQEASCLIS
jgi:purine-binding chemotaxis protein CheW